MNLNSVIRLTYLLGWASAVIAIIYRGLQMTSIAFVRNLPVTSRGFIFFSGLMFRATVATVMYAQSQNSGKTS